MHATGRQSLAGRTAQDGAPLHYQRHRPERTTLHGQEQLAAIFIAHTDVSTAQHEATAGSPWSKIEALRPRQTQSREVASALPGLPLMASNALMLAWRQGSQVPTIRVDRGESPLVPAPRRGASPATTGDLVVEPRPTLQSTSSSRYLSKRDGAAIKVEEHHAQFA